MMNEVLQSMMNMYCGMDTEIDLTEMAKLAKGLVEKKIPFTCNQAYDGMQIKCKEWDAVCHRGSYGHEDGLLEIMGSIVHSTDDDVEGWLTAEDILARL